MSKRRETPTYARRHSSRDSRPKKLPKYLALASLENEEVIFGSVLERSKRHVAFTKGSAEKHPPLRARLYSRTPKTKSTWMLGRTWLDFKHENMSLLERGFHARVSYLDVNTKS